jgi:hypothetical protein
MVARPPTLLWEAWFRSQPARAVEEAAPLVSQAVLVTWLLVAL